MAITRYLSASAALALLAGSVGRSFLKGRALQKAKIVVQDTRMEARSGGASTPMKMCIQAVLDSTGALRHMNKNNSERPVCSTRTSLPLPTFFCLAKKRERWVLLKIPRCDIDGVGEVK